LGKVYTKELLPEQKGRLPTQQWGSKNPFAINAEQPRQTYAGGKGVNKAVHGETDKRELLRAAQPPQPAPLEH
jgi:hypothetical protein